MYTSLLGKSFLLQAFQLPIVLFKMGKTASQQADYHTYIHKKVVRPFYRTLIHVSMRMKNEVG